MSRGGYTSAIDMWSAGCIFGELLQRVTYVGSAATPQLQVAPLFAIHGMPKTPGSGWVPARPRPSPPARPRFPLLQAPGLCASSSCGLGGGWLMGAAGAAVAAAL